MALVRVHCGISSAVDDASHVGAPARLTVAVVDDSGRLLECCDINDDPAGYAIVTGLLAERFGATTTVMIAVDSDDHLVVSLLAVSGRPIAYTDDETADDYAERFGHEALDDLPAEATERRAIGLARALQAGAVSAAVVPAPREYAGLKPILAAHGALAAGRQAAAIALREVLRELYPAALRAYPDPATPVALAMLDALPEPGLLSAASGKGRDAAVTVAARLVADGVCGNDAALEAVTSLRVAITETPRRNGVPKQITAAMAEAVRASVAAVRASDTAGSVLIHVLSEKIVPPVAVPAPSTSKRRITPTAKRSVAPAPPKSVAANVVPAVAASAGGVPADAVPVAAEPVPAMSVAAEAVAAQALPVTGSRPAWASATPPPNPPGFEPTPVTGLPVVPRQRTPAPRTQPPAAAEPLAPFVPTLTKAVISHERAVRGLGTGAPLPPAEWDEPALPPPLPSAGWEELAPQRPLSAPPGDRANWPLNGDPEDTLTRNGRVTPPWQADDLVQPPSLRVVSSGSPEPTAIPGRLVDDTALTAKIPKPRRTERAPGATLSDDTDLLIFASVSSAWFHHDGDGETTWNSAMDTGWRAAEEASLRPSSGGDTRAGLPRRVPAANLVPGSPLVPERPLRIVRDAGEIAAHTSNYFRGYRRGNQEAGGFSVGGRPGRESASGWDFSREHEFHDERDYGPPRAANYR